jgi:hypothetical protein
MQERRKLPKGVVAREKGRILVQVYDRRVGKRIGKTFDRRELAAAKKLETRHRTGDREGPAACRRVPDVPGGFG